MHSPELLPVGHPRFAIAAAVALAFSPIVAGQGSLQYIGRPGFTDSRHTRSDGFQSSTVLDLTRAGYTVGTSERFAGTPDPTYGSLPDQSAWMGSPFAGTKSIGLYDASHTSANGAHTTGVFKVTRNGFVVGHSTRYDGESVARGQSAWVATWGGGTRRIGLFYDDEEPPFPDGSLRNHVVDLNEAGQSIGYAPKARGREAWLADRLGNVRTLGFYDVDHVSPNHEPHNTPVVLNGSGTVVGESRWSNSQVVWLQPKNGGPPMQVGLYNADHTYSDGSVFNHAAAVNEHGVVVGRARNKFAGESASYPMYTIWARKPDGDAQSIVSNGAVDTVIQMTNSNLVAGEEYSSTETMVWLHDVDTGELFLLGLRFNTEFYTAANHLYGLTEDGVVLGSAYYSRGTYAWMGSPSSGSWRLGFNFNLGAPDAVVSAITAYASNGIAVGYSVAGYAEGYGQVGWIASPVTRQSYKIGLDDPVHLNMPNDFGVAGYHAVPTHVTASKFVAGYNVRYHGDYESEGQTAWVYNSPQRRYATFDFSVRASDGYSFSRVNQLLESGVAVGTYTKFADDGTDLGGRAFVWITGMGAFDIGENLDVDRETVNWDYLANAVLANEAGYISGHGVPFESTSQGVFLVRLQ